MRGVSGPPSAKHNSCRRALGRWPEAVRRPARTRSWRNASQLAGVARAEFGERFIGEPVEPPGFCVALDLAVETVSLERLEPGAEFRKLLRRELGDGFFDVFHGHAHRIAQ